MPIKRSQYLLSSFSVAMALVLTGCGGGGSSTPAAVSTISVSGVASAGPLAGADVKVYDALDPKGVTGTPLNLQPVVTDANGNYTVEVPATYATHPLIVQITGNATTTMTDEVLGNIAAGSLNGFTLNAVVPAASTTVPAAPITVSTNVTPITNVTYNIVASQIGQSDVDDAIKQANSVVVQTLTGGQNPLTTNPTTDPQMVIALATISNLANTAACSGEATAVDKIKCSVTATAGMFTPMAPEYDAAAPTNVSFSGDGATLAANLQTAAGTVAANATHTALTLEERTAANASNPLATIATGPVVIPPAATLAGVDKAKAFFTELRTKILPYYNPDGTGYLNTRAAALDTETRAMAVDGLLVNVQMVDDVATMLSDSRTSIGQGDYSCQKLTNTTATCSVKSGTYSVAFTATDFTHMTWTTSQGQTTLGTGSASQTANTQTMSGTLPPMSRYGRSTAVKSVYTSLAVTASTTGNLSTIVLSGSADDVDAAGKSTYSTAITTGNVVLPANSDTASASDWTASSVDLVGVFGTANYSLTGKIALTDLTASAGSIMGGKLKFTGDLMSKGGSFNFEGVELNVVATDANNDLGTVTFNGMAKNSATDSGLLLNMTMSRDANTAANSAKVSAHFTIGGVKSIFLNEITLADGSNAYTLNTSSGLTIDGATGDVMDGTTAVAKLQSGLVHYKDGTFESIL